MIHNVAAHRSSAGSDQFEELRHRLDAATTLSEVLDVMADAKSAKDRRGDQQHAALMGGLWVEAMVRADGVISEMRSRRELTAHGGSRGNQHTAANLTSCKLADLDVSQVEACRWRGVAKVEPEVREAYLRECLSSGRRPGV
ncbi:MAG: hypothetical protein ACRDNS_22100, partial [Trebonia sp.]